MIFLSLQIALKTFLLITVSVLMHCCREAREVMTLVVGAYAGIGRIHLLSCALITMSLMS